MKYTIEKNYNEFWVCLTVPNTPDYPEYYNNGFNYPEVTSIIAKTKTLKEAKKIIQKTKRCA